MKTEISPSENAKKVAIKFCQDNKIDDLDVNMKLARLLDILAIKMAQHAQYKQATEPHSAIFLMTLDSLPDLNSDSGQPLA